MASPGPLPTFGPVAAATALQGISRDPERWLPRDGAMQSVEPTLRLFCLPYAGGGASIYRTWSRVLPPEIEVRPIQLPGRGKRFREPPMRRLEDVCPLIADMLVGVLERPFALFGHSMGALVAYGLALELAARGGPAPTMLIVSARQAPHLPSGRPPVHDLPDAEFRRWLHQLGGTPPEVFADDELMELVLPLLRADAALSESARIPNPPPEVGCPVVALGASDDPEVAPDALAQWRAIAKEEFTLRLFTGGHFYFDRNNGALLATIADMLMSAGRAQGGGCE
jgi:medium-chain acyl-[acyl-carrier-protein] hydrolase